VFLHDKFRLKTVLGVGVRKKETGARFEDVPLVPLLSIQLVHRVHDYQCLRIRN
jgi:hypothetical protein